MEDINIESGITRMEIISEQELTELMRQPTKEEEKEDKKRHYKIVKEWRRQNRGYIWGRRLGLLAVICSVLGFILVITVIVLNNCGT